MNIVFYLLMISMHAAYAIIDFPIEDNKYVSLIDIHLAGPDYTYPFSSPVCNTQTQDYCDSYYFKYIGIGQDETELQSFKYPHALLTYENTTLEKHYNVPVLGIENDNIKHGLNSNFPFFVRVYKTQSNSSSLQEIYILFGILGVLFTCTILKRINNFMKAWLMRRKENQKISKAIKYVNNESSSLLNSNCTICLDDFEDDDKLIELVECRHVFHKHCLHSWLDQKKSCPNCQHSIV